MRIETAWVPEETKQNEHNFGNSTCFANGVVSVRHGFWKQTAVHLHMNNDLEMPKYSEHFSNDSPMNISWLLSTGSSYLPARNRQFLLCVQMQLHIINFLRLIRWSLNDVSTYNPFLSTVSYFLYLWSNGCAFFSGIGLRLSKGCQVGDLRW